MKLVNYYPFKITFISILLVIVSIQMQAQAKINQLDSKGRKTGIWEKRYPNNKLRYRGQFEAGKEVGTFYYYSIKTDKFPIVVRVFEKKTGIATVSFYTTNGVPESKGKMLGKERIGKWIYFGPDGVKIIIEENYENGLLNGAYISRYPNGQISEQSNYKNGKLNGNVKHFSDSGVLLDDLNYENGLLQGSAKYYSVKGKLIYSGDYEKDEKVGKWKYFSQDSTKIK